MPLPFAIPGMALAGKILGPIFSALARVAGRCLENPDVTAFAFAIGYAAHAYTSWNDVPDALAKAARDSRVAADRIDNAILQKQLATARADRDKLIELRDQDNAQNQEYINELSTTLSLEQRQCRLPTATDIRRLRLK